MILWSVQDIMIGVGLSSSYMNVSPSTSYMHGHKRSRGKHDEFLYYEALAKSSNPQEYQQRPENQDESEQHIVHKVDDNDQFEIDDVQLSNTYIFVHF